MSKHTNIHDSFFKDVLSDRQAAGIFLREHLPREVADLLAPDLPELLPGSFVDELLGQHHTDLLFLLRCAPIWCPSVTRWWTSLR